MTCADFLLGDLAAITMNGALLLALAAAVTIAVLMKLWPGLVLMTTSEELAFAEASACAAMNSC